MQIKTTMWHHLTPVRMDILHKSTSGGKNVEKRDPSALLVGMQPLWKTVWNFLKKLKMELPFDPVIPLLGIYPKNPEAPIQKNLCTPVHSSTIYNSQVVETAQVPISKWVDQKTVGHLHNGILRRWKKLSPTFCDSIDGTGEFYARWNPLGGERPIPYDLKNN